MNPNAATQKTYACNPSDSGCDSAASHLVLLSQRPPIVGSDSRPSLATKSWIGDAGACPCHKAGIASADRSYGAFGCRMAKGSVGWEWRQYMHMVTRPEMPPGMAIFHDTGNQKGACANHVINDSRTVHRSVWFQWLRWFHCLLGGMGLIRHGVCPWHWGRVPGVGLGGPGGKFGLATALALKKTRQWWCVYCVRADRHPFPPLVYWRLW